jgi:ABC-type transport system substrate-binding protein
MLRLNSFSISPDGTYAAIGGDSNVQEACDKLWEAGKWTDEPYCNGNVVVKLQKAKKTYDPEGRFRFYASIVERKKDGL